MPPGAIALPPNFGQAPPAVQTPAVAVGEDAWETLPTNVEGTLLPDFGGASSTVATPSIAPPAAAPPSADGWDALGFGTPAPAPAPAAVGAESDHHAEIPSAMSYLSRLKQEQDAALLMQANPADQRAMERAAREQATEAPASAPVGLGLGLPQYVPPPPVVVAPAAAEHHNAADIGQLEALGFSREMALNALSSHNGNLEQAANWLFSQ
jgi:hypothetical protein